MAEKLKSLTLTKTKLADIEGEHRVTFIASSPNEDRDYERVDIRSFRLPLKGGGHIVVQDLPENGSDMVDIPLLLDHDLYSVEKVIGSVRRAYYQDGNLIFEAGISSRPLAQEMFKLLEEGHLDNAFSIQYRDYNHDANTDYNGEIIEVSLVTRGSNMDASVLAVKSVKGEQVEEPTNTPEVVEETVEVENNDAVENTEKVEDEAVVEETETVEEATEEKADESATDSETTEEVEATEAETEAEDNNTNEKEENAMDNIAKGLVENKADQTMTAKSAAADYLKSKTAVVDFAKCIVANKGKSAGDISNAWKAELKGKGITGDAILPSRIENVFFKGWEDDSSILSTFRIIRSRASAMNAFLNTTNGRANGHKKGEAKVNQVIENVRRDLKQKVVYKKLPIDLQDLLDDETGELLAFRSEELSDRVLNAIAEGAVPGDGRSSGNPDLRIFDGTRGLFSMVADLNTAAAPLDTSDQNSKYAHAVATVIANNAGDNIYDKIIKALKFVRDKGYGKAVVVPFGTISDLKLEKLSNGNYLFQPGTSPETAIEARVFEMDEMDGCGYDVIAYAINGYGAYISDEMVRYDFDTTYNQDIMLVERAVAGSLYGHEVCAGYASASTTA